MCLNPQETANLVKFTEEILNRKLHSLCSVIASISTLNCSPLLLILMFSPLPLIFFIDYLPGGEVKWNKWRRATKWKSNVSFLFLFMFTAMPTLSHFRFSVWELPSCSSEITLTVRLQKAKNPWNNLTNLKRNISRKIAKWNTVKPFMTNKGTKSDDQITTNQWRENAIQFEAKHLTFVLQKVIW